MRKQFEIRTVVLYFSEMNGGSCKLIINPAAGFGRTQKLLPRIIAALERQGIAYQFVTTTRAGEATGLARQAAFDGFHTVVAVGGDGTVNEVAVGLVDSNAALGVIPTGNGNDFARSVKIPLDLSPACQHLRTGQTVTIDVGRVNHQFFFNEVGVGLVGDVARLAQMQKRGPGKWRYVIAALKALRTFAPFKVSLKIDQVKLEKKIALLSIGNGTSTGGGFRLTPDASPADGRLDLCVVAAASPWYLLRNLTKAYRGRHTQLPVTTIFRARHIEIASEQPLPTHVDGEVLSPAPTLLSVTASSHRLKVIAPAPVKTPETPQVRQQAAHA